MEARKLRPEELWRSRLNMAVAFEGDFDLEKERAKAAEDQADPAADHWGAFAPGEDFPRASLVMNKYDVRFDGRVVGMGGVGGVATLPAYRRGGAVRACMEASFRDLYDGGFVFSSLYPFSSAYYRQFGYEHGAAVQLWTLPLAGLKLPDAGGTVQQLFPGDDLSPLLQVYEAFYGNVNLSVVRKVYDEDMEKKNFMAQKRSVFVWRDERGEPGAFLIGSRDGETLNCRTDFAMCNGLLFRDARALQGILGFVRTAFLSNYRTIRFQTPASVNILSMVPEASSMECSWMINGMVRAVNVQRMLELCRCEGEGELVLRVEDPLLAENRDTFRLSFAPGRENRVERVSAEPDVSLGVGDLTTLVCGMRSAEELPWMPAVEVRRESAPLAQVFLRKPCHILDLF